MIREAHLGDVHALWILGKRIHMKSEDRLIPMDEAKARTAIAGLIGTKKGLVLVDEVDGMVTGLLAGFVDELWWSKRRYAVPLVVFADRKGALAWMLRRFVKWSFEQKGAVQVPLDCSFGGPLGEKTVAMLRAECKRRGDVRFEEVGASFIVRKEP